MIDQMTVGHQFLDRTFGYNPRIGWQVRQQGSEAVVQILSHNIFPDIFLNLLLGKDLILTMQYGVLQAISGSIDGALSKPVAS